MMKTATEAQATLKESDSQKNFPPIKSLSVLKDGLSSSFAGTSTKSRMVILSARATNNAEMYSKVSGAATSAEINTPTRAKSAVFEAAQKNNAKHEGDKSAGCSVKQLLPCQTR